MSMANILFLITLHCPRFTWWYCRVVQLGIPELCMLVLPSYTTW